MPNRIQGRRILFAFAHPDDEGFATGGTIAMLVSQGARVTLVCATNGDVGEISDPALATPETLGQVRQGELRRAMAITGVDDIRFLNYRDSGMIDTPDNDHPNAFIQAEAPRVVGELVAIMRQTQPHIVITHDPSGGYGHPDHTRMCEHATAAFRLAGDASAYPEGPPPWTPSLLYYVCFPPQRFSPHVARHAGPRRHAAVCESRNRCARHARRRGEHGVGRRPVCGHENRLAQLPPDPDQPQWPVFATARGDDARYHAHGILHPGGARGGRPGCRYPRLACRTSLRLRAGAGLLADGDRGWRHRARRQILSSALDAIGLLGEPNRESDFSSVSYAF